MARSKPIRQKVRVYFKPMEAVVTVPKRHKMNAEELRQHVIGLAIAKLQDPYTGDFSYIEVDEDKTEYVE